MYMYMYIQCSTYNVHVQCTCTCRCKGIVPVRWFIYGFPLLQYYVKKSRYRRNKPITTSSQVMWVKPHPHSHAHTCCTSTVYACTCTHVHCTCRSYFIFISGVVSIWCLQLTLQGKIHCLLKFRLVSHVTWDHAHLCHVTLQESRRQVAESESKMKDLSQQDLSLRQDDGRIRREKVSFLCYWWPLIILTFDLHDPY